MHRVRPIAIGIAVAAAVSLSVLLLSCAVLAWHLRRRRSKRRAQLAASQRQQMTAELSPNHRRLRESWRALKRVRGAYPSGAGDAEPDRGQRGGLSQTERGLSAG